MWFFKPYLTLHIQIQFGYWLNSALKGLLGREHACEGAQDAGVAVYSRRNLGRDLLNRTVLVSERPAANSRWQVIGSNFKF